MPTTRNAAPDPKAVGIKVGDFFVSSWGYDQTNIDFFKVIALTPKGIKVQQWQSKRVTEDGPQVGVVPGEEPATDSDWSAATEDMNDWERRKARKDVPKPILQKRLWTWGSQPAFTVNDYSSAYLWDGKPESQTGSGWGH